MVRELGGVAVAGVLRDGVRAALISGLRAAGSPTGRVLHPQMYRDPYPTDAWARGRGLVVPVSMGPTTCHHAVADALLRHPKVDTGTGKRVQIVAGQTRFSKWLFSVPPRGGVIDPLGPESMLGMDGEPHARLRRLASPMFTPSAVAGLRPRITEMAHEILDRALVGRRFDLMSTLAGQLPVWVICHLLGVPPADRAQVERWSGHLAVDIETTAPAARQREAVRVLRQVQDYLAALIEAKRRHPGDDLLSRLIEIDDGSERLSPRELLTMCMVLFLAGFETTVNLIGNGVDALVEHPEQADLLRAEATLVPNAVEEMLRYDAPVQVLVRLPREDLHLAGAHLKANVPFFVYVGGMNRDPAVFEHPDRFDVTRANARKHLSFAAGPHHCLGASLARLEGEVALAALLDRVGPLVRAGAPRRRNTFVMRGFESVPLLSRP